ncbi:MAG: MerR family transcriptional regulator [Candidatus Omnitrophica bacterium]|nr:MerR family transcriptional regulator [Candidatus Omnitrophota bacterium]
MKKGKIISALEVSKKFNISYQTVNHYTNLGLLIVRKREGNGRLYLESEVSSRLKRVDQLKNEGYPLRIIRKMVQ